MNNSICKVCPRNCGAVRTNTHGAGICGMGNLPRVALASLHMWEEPCISGKYGSGTVFFSGCSLKCVFCQNSEISRYGFGKEISAVRLREIFFELIDRGAHNINLVNPTHFSPSILEALSGPLPVPVVYNSSGYDSVETLKLFEDRVQVYLPDLKYLLPDAASRYSSADNYPNVSSAAIFEMFRQTGPYALDDGGLIKSGVIIRHLILPNNLENTYKVIDWVSDTFSPGDVLFSLMSQYTPCGDLGKFPELKRRLTRDEYEKACAYLNNSRIEDGFFQELSSAESEYIPDFDLSGIDS